MPSYSAGAAIIATPRPCAEHALCWTPKAAEVASDNMGLEQKAAVVASDDIDSTQVPTTAASLTISCVSVSIAKGGGWLSTNELVQVPFLCTVVD